MHSINMKTITIALIAIIVSIFICLSISQASKKFVLDELDFPVVAKATSESGLPLYYRGEASQQHLGIYHPPLYIYLLALHIKIFGFSENTVRSFGLLCTLLTAYLTILLGSRLSDNREWQYFSVFFVGLFLLNPYTLANTSLPDIDQTILPVLMTLFVLLLYGTNVNDRLLGLSFAALLWAKLTTPLALIPLSAIYWYSENHSINQTLRKSILVFGSGFALFLSTYWCYCYFFKLPFSYTFDFFLHSFTKGSASNGLGGVLKKIAQNVGYSGDVLMWMTLPTVFVFFLSLTYLYLYKFLPIDRRKVLSIMIFSVFVTVFYCCLIAPFGGFFKYPYPVFQFACLGVALVCSSTIESTHSVCKKTNWIIPRSAFLFLLFGATTLISGYCQIRFWGDHSNFGVRLSANNMILIGASVAILMGCLLSQVSSLKSAIILLIPIAFGVVIGVGVTISRYHAISPFPTKYSYGQRGMDQAISYLKERLQTGEVVWGMKDIGFYTGNRYEESYGYYFKNDSREKIRALRNSGIRYFVATKDIGEDRIDAYPDILSALEECCYLDNQFGNFYIYKARL
jgi:hypothetical protein